MLKNRVAALEKIVGSDSGPLCFFVRFHGVPLERAECEGAVFERTNDESEAEFDARVRRSVMAAPSNNPWIICQLIPTTAEAAP